MRALTLYLILTATAVVGATHLAEATRANLAELTHQRATTLESVF